MKNNAIKSILIFPPLEYPGGVQLAVPTLSAQLKHNHFDTEIYDFNIDFFYDVLSKEYIQATFDKIDNLYNYFKANKEDLLNKYNSTDKELLTEKIKNIENFCNNNMKSKDKLIHYIALAINTMHSDTFYNTKKYRMAEYTIKKAMSLISLPYSPINFTQGHFINYFKELKYEYIKKILFDENYNIFLQYYKNKLTSLYEKEPNLVGISIGYESQILAGLTIAYLIKQNTKAKVVIGGSLFTRKIDVIKQYPEFFDLFADFVMYGEGERAIVELARFINNEISIENIHNIAYKQNNEIFINSQDNGIKLSETQMPDYTGYDLKKYFSPEIIMPLEIQRSCGWGKCTFCDINYAKTLSRKNLDTLIKEIKNYKEKYNINNFVIIDSAMTPRFLNQFSDMLIQNNININFISDVRFDSEFTYEILKKAHKAGLKCLCWGIESINPRIAKLMNKNINIEQAIKTLQLADKAGIWNTIYIIAGFPTETKKEFIDNVRFVKKYKKIIHCVCLSKFALLKYTPIYNSYLNFGIAEINNSSNFNTKTDYKTNTGMDDNTINEVIADFNHHRDIFYESAIHNCYYSQMSQCILHYDSNYIKKLYRQKLIPRKFKFIKEKCKKYLDIIRKK